VVLLGLLDPVDAVLGDVDDDGVVTPDRLRQIDEAKQLLGGRQQFGQPLDALAQRVTDARPHRDDRDRLDARDAQDLLEFCPVGDLRVGQLVEPLRDVREEVPVVLASVP
jgi:hypothetical protein